MRVASWKSKEDCALWRVMERGHQGMALVAAYNEEVEDVSRAPKKILARATYLRKTGRPPGPFNTEDMAVYRAKMLADAKAELAHQIALAREEAYRAPAFRPKVKEIERFLGR